MKELKPSWETEKLQIEALEGGAANLVVPCETGRES